MAAREADVRNALTQYNQLLAKLRRRRIDITHGELDRAEMDIIKKERRSSRSMSDVTTNS
jgi:hypothetical protein